MKLPSIKDKELELAGKTVLLRSGMDTPMDDAGNVTDDTRIVDALPTIEYLLKRGAKIVIMAKVGRPGGKVVLSLSVRSIAARLSELLKKEVKPIDDCVGEPVRKAIDEMKSGDIIFLENVLFNPGEDANDDAFARELSRNGEIYINDAFSSSHRNQASIVGIPKYLPSYAGLLLEKEIKILTSALEKPKRPFVVVLGGAKVSDKIGALRNLGQKADKILIGGAMMFTFYKSRGFDVGASKVEQDKISVADDLINEFEQKIMLPVDVVVADKAANDARIEIVSASEIPKGWIGLDIGPESVKLFTKELSDARTIIWNGPLGVFELDRFAEGTIAIARAISEVTEKATTIIGGGDTLAAADKAGLNGKFSHSSTGGGAILELLEGKELPGVKALASASGEAQKIQ